MENNRKKNIVILVVLLVVLACGCVVGGYVFVSRMRGDGETTAQKDGSVSSAVSTDSLIDKSTEDAAADKSSADAKKTEDAAGESTTTSTSSGKTVRPTATPRPTATERPADASAASNPVNPTAAAADPAANTNPTAGTAVGSSGSGETYYADVDEYLTLRNGASTSAGEIERLAPCAAMKLIAKTNDTMWQVQVVSSGNTGYVNRNYIIPEGGTYTRINQGSTTSGGSTSSGTVYYANVDEYLTLRSGASTSASELARLAPKTEMTILEYTNDTMWYVQVNSTGAKGYVNKNYIAAK